MIRVGDVIYKNRFLRLVKDPRDAAEFSRILPDKLIYLGRYHNTLVFRLGSQTKALKGDTWQVGENLVREEMFERKPWTPKTFTATPTRYAPQEGLLTPRQIYAMELRRRAEERERIRAVAPTATRRAMFEREINTLINKLSDLSSRYPEFSSQLEDVIRRLERLSASQAAPKVRLPISPFRFPYRFYP